MVLGLTPFLKLVRGLPRIAPCLEHICAEGGNVAIEVYIYVLVFNPDRIVLIFECYITCVNLLFSNSRVQSCI